MAKIWNVVAYFIAQISALFITYLLWAPATGFIGEMDGFFKPIASLMLVAMLVFGNIIGPILVLTDDKITERFRGDEE